MITRDMLYAAGARKFEIEQQLKKARGANRAKLQADLELATAEHRALARQFLIERRSEAR